MLKKGCGHPFKGHSQNLTYPIAVSTCWTISSTESLVPAVSSVTAIDHKSCFFLILNHFLKFGYFSRYHSHILEKKWVWFPDAEFNSESIKSKKAKKLMWHFLFAQFYFLTHLIKLGFLIFFRRFQAVGSSTPSLSEAEKFVESRKISRIWQKKSCNYPKRNWF